MGNSSSSEFRRRYAYPGEITPALLESKPSTREPEPTLLAPKPAAVEPNPTVLAPKPAIFGPRPTVLAPKPAALDPRPSFLAQKPMAFGPKRNEVRLGVGLDSNRKCVNLAAWKDTIRAKKVTARFELLPDSKPRWDRISLSAAGQLTVLILLLLIPQIFPQEMQTALKFNVVEVMQPITEFPITPPQPLPPPRPPKIKSRVPPPEPKPPELKQEPVVPEPPLIKLNPRQPHVFLVMKPETRTVRTIEAKPVELNPVLEQVKVEMPTNLPKRPKDEVNTGALGPSSAAAATFVAPGSKVQTGGFGDPNGIAGRGNPSRGANINQAGSLLLGGPGNGNGSGGAKGLRGTTAEGPRKSASSGGGGNSPVSILDRPTPVYSNEGRTLRIEGDVVLEVIFLASGQVKVNAVVSGLGHGLDEAAIQAATQIRFKPAMRDGKPVDFPARLRIVFRVAS
jgi:TonB family protein